MGANPYQNRSDYQFWKRGGGFDRAVDFDPVTNPSFAISPADPVVTAGTCFAQHVSRHLAQAGFNVLVAEHAHPLNPDRYAA